MADLFDKRKPKAAAAPASTPTAGGRDHFGNAPKPKPAPQRQADSGVISDKAAAELKASAAEAAEKMKAGAGKLANQAGELASKAKSTWVPAVKTRVSQVKVPRIPGKTLALGAAVLTALAIGAYAWHAHSTAPETKTVSAPSPASSASTAAPSVAASTPAVAPIVPKVPGWNVAAGLKVLSGDTGPKQTLTCTLNFNPNIAGGWAHSAASIPGFLTVLDPKHGVIQASTADIAQQALSAADFALDTKCLTAAELQAQAQPKQPAAPVEATKAPEPVAVKPAPVPAPVATPTPAAVTTPQAATPPPVTKPVVVKAKSKPKAQPDNFEKNANAQLDAFFKH